MYAAIAGAAMMLALIPLRADACRPSLPDDRQRSTQEQRAAPINSAAALGAYLDAMPYDSPLLALSEPSRKRFTQSMTFNASGVTGFSYADIERELSVSQAYAVLALIGSQRVIVHLRKLAAPSDLDRSIRTAMAQQCPSRKAAPGPA